jgi:hypothetical protein
LIGSSVAEKEADHFMKWPRLLGQKIMAHVHDVEIER